MFVFSLPEVGPHHNGRKSRRVLRGLGGIMFLRSKPAPRPDKVEGTHWIRRTRVAAGEEVTRLLIEWKSGSKEAMDLLVPLVYDEMRRLAQRYLRDEGSAATLQPTALVHEAYLRLVAH